MRPRIFRPQPRTFVALALVLVAMGTFGAILFSANQQQHGSGIAIPGFCLVLYVIAFGIGFVTMFRNLWLTQLTVDETRLTGQIGAVKVDVRWDEIRVIRYENNKLTLATLDQTYTLPLEQLDGATIWQTIQPLVRPQALSPTAYQEHPAHQALIAFRQHALTLPCGLATFYVDVEFNSDRVGHLWLDRRGFPGIYVNLWVLGSYAPRGSFPVYHTGGTHSQTDHHAKPIPHPNHTVG